MLKKIFAPLSDSFLSFQRMRDLSNVTYMFKVQILEKYKKALSEKFNIKNAKFYKGKFGMSDCDRYVIEIPCILCEVYFDNGCYGCPFARFAKNGIHKRNEIFKPAGCFIWLWMIGLTKFLHFKMDEQKFIWFAAREYDAVKEQLEQIRKKACKYIEWV